MFVFEHVEPAALKLIAATERNTDPAAAAAAGQDWDDIHASLHGEGDAYSRW